MFYETAKNDHGLPHNPFKAIVAPRPIGWISSMSAKGEINLAPYSFFNGIKKTGLAAAPSRLVKPPRVKDSPCALECKWLQTVRLTDLDGHLTDRYVVFGQVVGVYIDDTFIKDGKLDTAAMRPIARAGYHDYFVGTPETKFSLARPKGGGAD